MEKQEKPTCPHCGARLLKWLAPAESTWGETILYVCFNDDCDYFKNGWNHMWNKYQQKASYRHRLDPVTGQTGPLPVWSEDATRNRIVPFTNKEE